jgi:predicted ABC-type ATPase
LTEPTNAAARYLLSEAESRRIFRARIVPQLMSGREPQSTPTVVVLVGQPGAGKSRVAAVVADQLKQRGGFVDVDTDLYKPYHPAYSRLLLEDDRLMAAYTGPDGRRWMQLAHNHVREYRLNAVIQEIAQDGESAARTITEYRATGFGVEVLVLGVHETMSNQGILNRYHEQVKERGHGRLTVQAKADESYAGILALSDMVDARRIADQVAVFRRGESTPRYRNNLTAGGDWQTPPGLRTAISTERDRPWSAAETLDFQQTHAKLRSEMPAEWHAQLDSIADRAAPLMDSTDNPKPDDIRNDPRPRRAAPHRYGSATPSPPPRRPPPPGLRSGPTTPGPRRSR